MKNTSVHRFVTKLILTKSFSFNDGCHTRVFKPGRVLATIRHPKNYYYAWPFLITLGHGWSETIPTSHLKVKWFEEIKTTTYNTKEVPVSKQ